MDIKRILKEHALWLNGNPKGKRAHLEGANLEEANLREAYLRGAHLAGANLKGANLEEANLREAYLRGAHLAGANLRGAHLAGANLRGANLYGANLREACLRGAYLGGANLYGANLERAILPHFQIVPEIGPFQAYKRLADDLIGIFQVPATAKRTSTLVGRKCRVSKAKLLRIETLDQSVLRNRKKTANWNKNYPTVYTVGEMAKPDKYDGDIRIECTHGIHLFMTRKEAEEC